MRQGRGEFISKVTNSPRSAAEVHGNHLGGKQLEEGRHHSVEGNRSKIESLSLVYLDNSCRLSAHVNLFQTLNKFY